LAALGVCLSLAALAAHPAGAPVVFVPTPSFTLAWTHSIEKVRWEEDYALNLDAAGQPRLHATAARIRGSAAGMEPPPDAVLRGGWYHYTPSETHPALLRLTRSEFTPDYDWCMAGRCQSLSTFIASDQGVTWAWACFGPKIPPTMPP